MKPKQPRRTTCAVCLHPERHRIETLRIGGLSLDACTKRFGVGRDALWRHMRDHVTADERAMHLAGVSLREMADRAADESVALVDYLAIVRSALMQQFLSVAAEGQTNATAVLAGRLMEVLREIGRLTGEMMRIAPVMHVTNNVLISSPVFLDLQSMLVERLASHPEALAAVVEGLRELEARQVAPKADRAPALPQIDLTATVVTNARTA